MRTTFLATFAAVVLAGCAVDEKPVDGLEVTTVPGHVEGTFAQDGVSLQFEITETTISIKTIDGVSLVEATPSSVVIVDGLADMEEGKLMSPFHDALGSAPGIITCPGPGTWWQQVSSRIDGRIAN